MDKATNATARAQTLFKAAISSTVSSAAVQLITRLQPIVQVADIAKTQAAVYVGKESPEPKLKQTSDEGIILEQHEDVQIQRTPDGKTMVRFTNQAVVYLPADPQTEPTTVMFGDAGKEDQIQFTPPGNDAACFCNNGDVLQVLLSAGGVLVAKISGDIVQIIPPSVEGANKPSTPSVEASVEGAQKPSTLTEAVAYFLKAATTETPYTTTVRFESETSGDLKGCIFSKQSSEAMLQHPSEDIIEKSHWTEARTVCVLRDGTMCERRKDGKVLVVETLDEAAQSLKGKSASGGGNGGASGGGASGGGNGGGSSTVTSALSVDDIDLSNGNKTTLVQTLKAKQAAMETTKQQTTQTLTSAFATYTTSKDIWSTADAARKVADIGRQRCIEIATAAIPTDATELAKDGVLMQEEVGDDGMKTIMIKYKNGTQKQVQESSNGAQTFNVALSDQEEVCVANPGLVGSVFQQTVDKEETEGTTKTMFVLKAGGFDGTQVMFMSKGGVLEHVVVVGVLEHAKMVVQFTCKKNDANGAVEMVSLVDAANKLTVQIMVLTQPMKIRVIYDAGEVKVVQMSQEQNEAQVEGLVVMRNGTTKSKLEQNGTFTVEQSAEGCASSVLQMSVDGHLLIIKSDGSQWRFTGTELHAMQQVASVLSPRAKLQAAKTIDAKLNK